MSTAAHLAVAREVLAAEAAGLGAAAAGLDAGFGAAVEILLATTGKAVLTGVGKSGLVARKVAATLASTGTPAFFLHPADAGHGDLGMVARGDTLVALSRSGEAGELAHVIDHGRRLGAPLVALTGAPASTLGRAADACVPVTVAGEACPHGLAPTVTTTAALAVGDALAMALVQARGFSPEDFARTHPDGALGRRMLVRVRDLMLTDAALPLVAPDATLAAAIVEMSAKRLGMALVAASDGGLAGILTDGDLRRCLERAVDIHRTPVAAGMSATPRTTGPDRLASEALACMEEHSITHLPVLDAGRLVGALDIHLLVRHRIA